MWKNTIALNGVLRSDLNSIQGFRILIAGAFGKMSTELEGIKSARVASGFLDLF